MRLASERELAVCLESEFPECANAKLFSPRLAEITSAEVNTGPTRVLSAPTTAAEHSTAGMRLWVAVTAVLALAVLTIAVSRSRSTVDGAIAAPSAAPVEPSAAGVPDTQSNPRPPPAPTVEPESLTPKPRSRRRPSPAKRVAGNGSLTLQTNPWTHVFIDGERVGMTPIFELELAAGPKTLRLVNKELGVDERTRVRIRPGRTERLKLNLVRNDEASAPESAP
ncbi:MAG: PEGA domain-containing protein [Myxococcota bacterium]